jgi:hypothetical protein
MYDMKILNICKGAFVKLHYDGCQSYDDIWDKLDDPRLKRK